MRAETLLREVERLEARRQRSSRRRVIPADRVEFARMVGIEPDPWQRDLLGSEAPRVILNISRQAGKSSMAALLALHQALTVPGSLVLALAPALRQSQELFHKVATYYRALGEVMPADSHRKLGMVLANGSRIEALPGSERTIRGFSAVDLLILDEAARVDDALYQASRPFLAVSGGKMVMMSTPYGKRGVFHHEWTEGSGWERYRVTAEQCPRIPASFLEEERVSLPVWVYRQEYGCEFAETDDQVFGYDLVASSISGDVEPLFLEEES